MPRSIFLGRPWPNPGEPLFLDEDTAWAVALAEEERDACPSCGMPKDICRSGDIPFTDYEVREETCQPTLRLAHHRNSDAWKSRHEATKHAVQASVRFRDGKAPRTDYGLGLAAEGGEQADE